MPSVFQNLYELQDFIQLRALAAKHPDDAAAAKYLALMHVFLGQRQDAVKLLDTFLERNPRTFSILELFSEVILGAGKAYSEMKDLLRAFRRISVEDLPHDKLKMFYAETLFHTGFVNEARNIFDRLQPERYPTYYRDMLGSPKPSPGRVAELLRPALDVDLEALRGTYSELVAAIKPGSPEEGSLRNAIGRFESYPSVRDVTSKHVGIEVSGKAPPSAGVVEMFLYGGESDMLHLHFQATKDFVDHYVIIQGDCTFTGSRKQIYDVMKDDRFTHLRDRITLVNLKFANFDCPYFAYPWFVEAMHRNAAQRAMPHLSQTAVYILSDVDEILRPNTIDRFKSANVLAAKCRLRDHRFFLNYRRMPTEDSPLAGFPEMATIATGKVHAEFDAFTIRVVYSRQRHFHKHAIHDAGWHFSSVGSPAEIKRKFMNYSHTENVISGLGIDFYTDLTRAAKGDKDAQASIRPITSTFMEFEHYHAMPIVEPEYPAALVNSSEFSHLIIPA